VRNEETGEDSGRVLIVPVVVEPVVVPVPLTVVPIQTTEAQSAVGVTVLRGGKVDIPPPLPDRGNERLVRQQEVQQAGVHRALPRQFVQPVLAPGVEVPGADCRSGTAGSSPGRTRSDPWAYVRPHSNRRGYRA